MNHDLSLCVGKRVAQVIVAPASWRGGRHGQIEEYGNQVILVFSDGTEAVFTAAASGKARDVVWVVITPN